MWSRNLRECPSVLKTFGDSAGIYETMGGDLALGRVLDVGI